MRSVILVPLVTVALLATVNAPFVARNAAATATTWVKTYGGLESAMSKGVESTADGGYVVLGQTSPADQNWDIWILKLDASGAVEWQYLYGGSGRDLAYTIRQISDGGYIVAAGTYSFGPGGPTSAGPSSLNAWILKLDAFGGVMWQNVYGGDGNDVLVDIRQISDGGYIAAGYSTSHRPGVAYEDAVEAWVVKLNSAGNLVWQKAYGSGNPYECASSIQQTSDGGYIVAGSVTLWPPGGAGVPSLWLFKLTSTGTLSWQKTYGAGNGGLFCKESGEGPQVLITPDGGFLMTLIYRYGPEQDDGWVLKVDSTGRALWRKSYGRPDGTGGVGREHFLSVDATTDGYILAGHLSDGTQYVPWVIRLSSDGTVQLQKTYALSTGSTGASGNSIVHQTSDGGFILVGSWSGNLIVYKLGDDCNAGGCSDPGIGADSSVTVKSSTAKASGYKGKAVAPSTSVTITGATPVATEAYVGTVCTG